MNNTSSIQYSSLMSFKKQVVLTNIPLLSLLGLITAVINGLLVWVIITDPLRTFRRPKVIIDLWMSLSQFLVGIILVPLILADEILNGVYNENYTALATLVVMVTRLFLAFGSQLAILSILEGTGGITNPHLVRRITTKKSVTIAVCVLLVFSFIYSLLLVLGVSEKVHSVIFVHVFIILPTLIASVVFVRTYKRIRNPKKVTPTSSINVFNKEKLKMTRIRNERIARNFSKTILMFFTPSIISLLSYYIFIMMKAFSMIDGCEVSRWCIVHKRLMLSFILVHYAFTPLFLAYKVTEYRNAVKHVLRKTIIKIRCRN
jgi:hypothetical protein